MHTAVDVQKNHSWNGVHSIGSVCCAPLTVSASEFHLGLWRPSTATEHLMSRSVQLVSSECDHRVELATRRTANRIQTMSADVSMKSVLLSLKLHHSISRHHFSSSSALHYCITVNDTNGSARVWSLENVHFTLPDQEHGIVYHHHCMNWRTLAPLNVIWELFIFSRHMAADGESFPDDLT